MNAREKGIVGLMVGTVIFGAFHFFSPGVKLGPLKAQEELKELDQFIVSMAATLNKPDLVEARYILEKAAAPCRKNPFWAEKVEPQVVAKKEDLPQPEHAFIYSGFVCLGNKMLAIINGLEYESGDMLDPGGYRVGRITAEQVILNRGLKENKVLQLMNENR